MTIKGKYNQGSSEELLAKKTINEYISQRIESKRDYEDDQCTDEMVWWCVGRLFSETYDIKYSESGYGYIFYQVKFDNGNHLLLSTEFINGEWKVTQNPIKAGGKATYLGTHSKGKKFKILQVRFNNDGDVHLKAIIEK